MKVDGKKVTVKFIANTKHKPAFNAGAINPSTKEMAQDDLYQLYAIVTYDRMYTEFTTKNLGVDGAYAPESFDWDSLPKSSKLYKDLRSLERRILSAVSLEKKMLGERFKLAGLGRRMRYYCQSLWEIFGKITLEDISHTVEGTYQFAFQEGSLEKLSNMTFSEYADFIENLSAETSLSLLEYLSQLPYQGDNPYLSMPVIEDLAKLNFKRVAQFS